MGFDYAEGHFTPDNHKMLPIQVTPWVNDMKPKDIFYVEAEAIVVDDNRNVWINKSFSALDSTQVIQQGYADESTSFARIICIEEGLIVDQSHKEQRSWQSRKEKVSRAQADLVIDHPEDYLPIIHRVFNTDELGLIEEALATQHNISLEGTELQPLIAYIGRLLSDEDESFVVDDEDEEHPT